MKQTLIALTALLLLALTGCTTASVATTSVTDTAAIDRAMPSNAQSPYCVMSALEADPAPVHLER